MRVLAFALLAATLVLLALACQDEKGDTTPTPTIATTPTPRLTVTPTVPPTPEVTPTEEATLEPTPAETPTPPWETPTPRTLTVHFIDVGQGDAIFVELDDIDILVDGGSKGSGVVNYLESQEIDDIDLLVATHPHADHIGGLPDVLALYEVVEVWTNGQSHTSQTYQNFVAAVAAEGATEQTVGRGYVAHMDDLEILVLHPASPLSGDLNEDSVVLQVSCGQVAILLTGNATTGSEGSMQAAGVLGDVEVLKVGHHGSNTSTSEAFLATVTPEDAIISVGAGNAYGHPHQETLDRLAGARVAMHRTDLHGTLVLTSDCKTYSMTPSRQET